MGPAAQLVSIPLEGAAPVSGLLQCPAQATACYVMAHGAGAGMRHAFMAEMANALAAQGIATLRFQFPSMEQGSRRPDNPAVAHAAVRAAVAAASRLLPGAALFAGGKSFGGRMTSQAQAAAPLPGVHALVFVGFPLHPSGKPSTDRARHLDAVELPMLFLQGTRDLLADMTLVRGVVAALGTRATLEVVEQADHAFHIPARSGGRDAEVIVGLSRSIARWIGRAMARADQA
ncbi:MAG: alpha/beta family hydrolase [Betaproteobacteria bacterium]